MTRLDEIRHSAWQHRNIDITEDYAQGHEQPWASIRLRDPLRVGWATVAGWLVVICSDSCRALDGTRMKPICYRPLIVRPRYN